VADINDVIARLDSPTFGLAEIQSEVFAVEMGNAAIGAGVGALGAVTSILFPTVLGIQSEVAAIESNLINLVTGTGQLTTGPVVRDSGVSNIAASLLNHSSSSKLVTLTFNQLVGGTPVATLGTPTSAVIPNNSFVNFSFMSVPSSITEFEVVFSGMAPGVYGWVSGQDATGQIKEANAFKHTQLVPFITP